MTATLRAMPARPAKKRSPLRRLELMGYQIGGAAILLLIWIWLTHSDPAVVNPLVLPQPMTVWDAIWKGLSSGGTLRADVWLTFREFIFVMGLSVVIGIALGTLPGLKRGVYRSVEPLIGLILSLPIVSYLAILVVVFGYGYKSVIVLGVIASAPSVIVSTITAFQEVDPMLLRVGQVYCENPRSAFRRVVLPAALPTLASGLRIAAGRALVGVIVGEMFMASNGLGAGIVRSQGFFDIPGYYAIVVCLAVLCYGVTLVFAAVERRVNAGLSLH